MSYGGAAVVSVAELDQRLVAQLRHAVEVDEPDDVAVRAGSVRSSGVVL